MGLENLSSSNLTHEPMVPRTRWHIENASKTVLIRDLCHSFGQGQSSRVVLSDVKLRLDAGELVIMTGPSGSGKTTLLTLMGGLRQLQRGNLRVLGRDLRQLAASELVEFRKNIGFIFQHHNLFESLTAYQNVRMALELNPGPERELKDKAIEVLERVGLEDYLDQLPRSLSGGQRQRVAIARALANRPRVVLADEPTASLDRISGEKVLQLLHELTDGEDGGTVVLVTHDQRLIDRADRIVNMVDGQIASDVSTQRAVQICEFLSRCEAFKGMDLDSLTEITQSMTLENFSEGSTIVREGDEGDQFFLIIEGNVDVLRNGELVATLGRGDFFGESALVTGEPRNATIVSSRPVTLCSLPKQDFQKTLTKSRPFREHLLQVLFKRQ